MHYSEVWRIAGNLPKGKAFAFSANEINDAAKCQLESAFDTVRRGDVIDFTKNLEEQFGVDIYENPITGAWVMKKKEDEQKEQRIWV